MNGSHQYKLKEKGSTNFKDKNTSVVQALLGLGLLRACGIIEPNCLNVSVQMSNISWAEIICECNLHLCLEYLKI